MDFKERLFIFVHGNRRSMYSPSIERASMCSGVRMGGIRGASNIYRLHENTSDPANVRCVKFPSFELMYLLSILRRVEVDAIVTIVLNTFLFVHANKWKTAVQTIELEKIA